MSNSNYNSKFDGPSFVNPNHTSHSLGNNNYQTPTYVPTVTNQKKDEAIKNSKKGPKGKLNLKQKK